MEKTDSKMVKYGLIGRGISYSFSREYFTRKFRELGLEDHVYHNYDLGDIGEFPDVLNNNPGLRGLNVTIPYKEAVIPYLHHMHADAEKVGAVNTIRITKEGLTGYNTDVYGFRLALESQLLPEDRYALILGTGGASKAVAYVLRELQIGFTFVSRTPGPGQLGYGALDPEIMSTHTLIINTTPLGTYPGVDEKPPVPYKELTAAHFLFDLIYNPGKTAFLREGEQAGARITNGLDMLEKQAEKAWEIWNS